MKNKKGFLLRDIVITGLLFFGVIALFLILVTSASNGYNRPDIIDSKFSNNFNKLNTLVEGDNGIDVVRGSVSNPEGLQLLGNFDIACSSMWTVFSLVWSTIDLYAGMGANFISTFTFIDASVIKIVFYVLVSILVTITIFNIISSVTRGRV